MRQAAAPRAGVHHEGRRAGTVWRREESQSCPGLALGISKVSLRGERSNGSRCKACWALKTFQPAQAEHWLSFQRASANSCWVSGGDQLVATHRPAQLARSWLLCSGVRRVVKMQSTAWAAQPILGVTSLAGWIYSKAGFAPESKGCVHTHTHTHRESDTRTFPWPTQAAELGAARAEVVSVNRELLLLLCHGMIP